MDLLRLSTQQIEFEYNKYDNMQSQITLFNDSINPIAYKFKATNLNIFLVRPPLGIVQPRQSQLINITLHSKVLETNSINEFNEKLQLITTIAPSTVMDAGSIFLDKMKKFEKQRINVAILSKDRKIVAQSSGTSNLMFQSVNKQFGSMDPTRIVAIPTVDKARSEAEYFCNKFEVIQQEVLQREQELLNVQRINNGMLEKQQTSPKRRKLDKILFLLLMVLSFVVTHKYQDEIMKHII